MTKAKVGFFVEINGKMYGRQYEVDSVKGLKVAAQSLANQMLRTYMERRYEITSKESQEASGTSGSADVSPGNLGYHPNP